VKAQAAERENWNCDTCRAEKVRMLQEELQNALRQIDELKARNRELEAKLPMAGNGERDTMPKKQKVTKCMEVGESIVCKVGAERADMKVECCPGIKMEQLHRVMEKGDLVSPETVIIHVGTNDLRTTRNLPNCRLVLSGVEMCHGGVLRHLMIDSTG